MREMRSELTALLVGMRLDFQLIINVVKIDY
jgi:hypothetical protein